MRAFTTAASHLPSSTATEKHKLNHNDNFRRQHIIDVYEDNNQLLEYEAGEIS